MTIAIRTSLLIGFSWICGTIAHAEQWVLAGGGGDHPTLQAAIDAAPSGNILPHVIRLGPGEFKEKIHLGADKGPIHLIGAGPGKSVVVFNDFASMPAAPARQGKQTQSLGTSRSATFTVLADDFAAEDITFRNDHGNGSQAVACASNGARARFTRCEILGWQDTLLVNNGSAMFVDCTIAGHCDYIFGAGRAWFEKCEIRSLAAGYIAAPSTPADSPYGFVFNRCTFTPATADWITYLARPWRAHGAMIVMHCELPAIIHPAGWHNWDKSDCETTARFADGGNSGPGADRRRRVAWSRDLRPEELASLSPRLALGWSPDAGLLPHRLAALTSPDRTRWLDYLAVSRAKHAADVAALADSRHQAGITAWLVAPDGKDFSPPMNKSAAWQDGPEAKTLADRVISFQAPSGGWSKHVDYSKGPRLPGMHWSSQGSATSPWHYAATFDNNATTAQLRFLLDHWRTTRRDDARQAILRGIDYILAAQFPNGGWPQVYPLEGGYHDNITLNDNAYVMILRTLDLLLHEAPATSLLDAPRRRALESAWHRGMDLLLQLQVRQDHVPTVWCAQYDPLSLLPAAARLKEPAALSGGESVGVVEFLMDSATDRDRTRPAIEAALVWFGRSAIHGIRKVHRNGKAWYDPDPHARDPIWARFYDIHTNRPMFPGAEDGIIYADFNTMQQSNKADYAFYVDDPAELLAKKQLKWRKIAAPPLPAMP